MERRTSLIIWVLGVLILTSLAANLLPGTEDIRLGLLILQQLLLAVAGFLGSRRATLKLSFDRHLSAWGFLAGVGIFAVNRLTGVLSQGIARELLGNEVVQDLILRESAGVEVLLTSNRPLIFFATVLLLTIGTPLGEELFFRGLLMNLLQERYGAKKAVLFSALTFALLHSYVLQFIPVFIAGILLGILFLRSDRIIVPIIAHATVNGLVLVFWLLSL